MQKHETDKSNIESTLQDNFVYDSSNKSAKVIFLYVLSLVITFIISLFLSLFINYRVAVNNTSDYLYRQALQTSEIYGNALLSSDFSNNDVFSLTRSLNETASLENISITAISSGGNVAYISNSSKNAGLSSIYRLDDFDFTQLGKKHVETSTLYNIFQEKHLNVYAPVIDEYTTRGYIIFSVSEEYVLYTSYSYLWGEILIFIIGAGVSLIFLIYYIICIQNPLSLIAEAIETYNRGKFDIAFDSKSSGEIGHLEHSLKNMAEKIKNSEDYQKQFLSNVSHDFRSPLTSITGYLNAFKDGTIPKHDAYKYIDRILYEAERLKNLTEDIISLNELDPNTITLSPSDFDINANIKSTIETFEKECMDKNICFNLNFPSEQTFVYADQKKYQQVIYNLVDNAIKFSPENSSIDINVKDDKASNKAVISIKDHGPGIKNDDIKNIWNRFFKGDASRGIDKKSSGLGLSIVKEIIDAHNESIYVKSSDGAEFIFTVPLSNDA